MLWKFYLSFEKEQRQKQQLTGAQILLNGKAELGPATGFVALPSSSPHECPAEFNTSLILPALHTRLWSWQGAQYMP